MRLQIKQLRKLIREEIENQSYNRDMETKVTQNSMIAKFNTTKYASASAVSQQEVEQTNQAKFHSGKCFGVSVTPNTELSMDNFLTKICKTLKLLGFNNISTTRYDFVYGNSQDQIVYFERGLNNAINLIVTM